MRRTLAFAMLAMLCFFAIAVYTPLHQHKNGDPKQCSLNNIEYQVADSAAPFLDFPRPSNELAWLHGEASISLPPSPVLACSSRGPPASSSHSV